MTAKMEFSDWFCLANGRKNFQIDPVADNQFLFGEPDADERIKTMLKRAELLSLPMRVVWWGQYGIGKTHRLRHTARVIRDNDYAFTPYYVMCGDIHEKTGFERLHYQMVSVLDMKTVCEHVTSYILKLRTGSDLPSLDDLCGTSADVKQAIKQFGSENELSIMPSWQFLCGLKPDNLSAVGATKPCLQLTGDFIAVITTLATIIEKETGKQLFYLIDEVEKLTRVTNKTAEAAWNETLRALLDIRNVNTVMAVGAEKLDQLPKLVLMPDIVRRIQKDNYVHMDSYKEPVATSFVNDLLQGWIDPERRDALADSEDFCSQHPGYTPQHYPFAGATVFQMFIDNVTVDLREAKPSVILDKLNTVAAEAFLRNERLVTRSLLTDLDYA